MTDKMSRRPSVTYENHAVSDDHLCGNVKTNFTAASCLQLIKLWNCITEEIPEFEFLSLSERRIAVYVVKPNGIVCKSSSL